MNGIIHTSFLAKAFGRTIALDGLDLDVPAGSIFALVGPNGAGKTTAIKLLMGIHTPSSGTASVFDADSRRLTPAHFARIGYVSENQEMPEWMTAGYFLDYWKPFYPTWDRQLEAELVRQFELPLDRKLRHLSRGMRMKAALASSLAYRPELIVLDEPFSGLDALVRDELIEGILDRASESTIFISSHDLAEIESFATHVGYLENGSLRFAESMESLAARFREVTVTVETPTAIPPEWPPDWPSDWLQAESANCAVRFVDARFDAERTPAEVRRLLPGVREIESVAMPLRAIFVALAKSGRRANG